MAAMLTGSRLCSEAEVSYLPRLASFSSKHLCCVTEIFTLSLWKGNLNLLKCHQFSATHGGASDHTGVYANKVPHSRSLASVMMGGGHS